MKPPKTHKRTAACNIYQSFSKEDPNPSSEHHLEVVCLVFTLKMLFFILCPLISDPLVNQMVQHCGVLGRTERSARRMLCYWSQTCWYLPKR